MTQENTNWDVRKPLLYGSLSIATCRTEQDARAFAEQYGKDKVKGFSGLRIHTRTRTVYIEQDDED